MEFTKRKFEMNEEEDFAFLYKVLSAYARKLRGNAKNTKTGYGSCRSEQKEQDLLNEAEFADSLLNRMAEIFN